MSSIIDEIFIFEILLSIGLYIFLFTHKIFIIRRNKKIQQHKKFLLPYMIEIMKCFENNVTIDRKTYSIIEKKLKNKHCYEIITFELINYLTNKECKNANMAIEFCEQLSLIDIEINRLKTNETYEKMYAIKRLGEYRSNLAIDKLCSEFYMLNSNGYSNLLEYNILVSLSKIGDLDAFIEIIDKVNFDTFISFNALIETIDQFNGNKEDLYSKLINLDSESLIRATILSAGMKNFHHIVDDVVQYCNHENMELRIAAIKFLGEVGDSKYCSNVAILLTDSNWEVQAIAAKSLGNLSPKTLENKKLITSLSLEQWYIKSNAVASLLLTIEGVKMLDEFLSDKVTNSTLKHQIASIVIDHFTSLQALKIDVQKGKIPERKRSYKFLQIKDSIEVGLLTAVASQIIEDNNRST